MPTLKEHFAERRAEHERRLSITGDRSALTLSQQVLALERRIERNGMAIAAALARTPAPHTSTPRSAFELARTRAHAFEEAVAAHQADGLSAGDAMIAAGKADPRGYDAYVEVTAVTKQTGAPLALAGGVAPTIEKTKPTSTTSGRTEPSALAIINAKAAEIMAATGCSNAEAITRALRESPSLYADYVGQLRRRAAGSTRLTPQDEG